VIEDIGALLGITMFFALSLVAGWLYGRGAGWILRSQERHGRLRKVAAALPPIFAVYMLACAIVFSVIIPGEADRIFFGDVYEPLPNGYTLRALAKMPASGWIEANSARFRETASGPVGSIAVDGPFVYGGLSPGPEHSKDYFGFDTRDGTTLNFDTIAELNRHAGHPVRLAETFSFRSSEAARIRLKTVERWIWYGPPVICSVCYLVFLLRLRRRDADGARMLA
jgi:hypothetical protein